MGIITCKGLIICTVVFLSFEVKYLRPEIFKPVWRKENMVAVIVFSLPKSLTYVMKSLTF